MADDNAEYAWNLKIMGKYPGEITNKDTRRHTCREYFIPGIPFPKIFKFDHFNYHRIWMKIYISDNNKLSKFIKANFVNAVWARVDGEDTWLEFLRDIPYPLKLN